MYVHMQTPSHPIPAKPFALGKFHRILSLLSHLLANTKGIAAKDSELHFIKHKS